MNSNYERYQKHILLPEIGWEGQQKLQHANVLVVGAGGLGCPVLQYLTAAGIGTIGIVDDDVVSVSNLQRQVLYSTAAVGRLKVEVAREALLAMNPTITIHTYAEKLTESNAAEILTTYDLLIDCTDNLKARYVINDACVAADKPFVYGSIHRFDGQVAVFNYQNGPTYRCLFTEGESEPPNCADVGVLGVLPGMIGTYQALEVIKLITGIGEPLSGKLLMVNTLQNLHRVIKVSRRSPDMVSTVHSATNTEAVLATIHKPPLPRLQYLLQNTEAEFIDVRENAFENTIFPVSQTHHIPLSQLAGYVDDLPRNKPIIIFCQTGRTSRLATQLLIHQYGFTNVENLEGGLNAAGIS